MAKQIRQFMEQDEITRRNVAIAEYMHPNLAHDHHFIAGSSHEYHCSWEWLMPVVETILDESNLGFHLFPPMGHETFTCRFGMGKNHVGDTMIEATWLAVSEYVLALK